MRRAVALVLVFLTVPLAARVRAVRSPAGETPEAWLRSRAVSDAGFAALARDKSVVALGDATHGSHETYAAKQRLIPLLVNEGFRTIAFEAPYAEWAKLDEYVLHGTGDPAAALNFRMYWFWDTDEILDIVRWARAQNEAGLRPPIRITGVDSTEPASAAKLVVDFLRRVDPAAAAEVEETYACLAQLWLGATFCDVSSVRPMLEAKRELYANATSAAVVEEMLHVARIVEQGKQVMATRHAARDAVMAENIEWLVDRGEKVIVVGHNEHWGQTPYRLVQPELIKSAGMYLSEALGERYFVLGSLLLDGTFLAIDYEGSFGEIRAQVMTPASPDDFATLFDRAGLETMIVPMSGPLPNWLAGTHRMRIAGSAVQSRAKTTLDLPADFGKKFDAVLYSRRSTPTRLRHWPMF